MSAFFSWYLIATIIGWLAFPLAHSFFPKLVDRGYALSRALGLLISGYCFWLLASIGIAQNDLGGIFLALAILAGMSLWILINRANDQKNNEDTSDLQRSSVIHWIGAHSGYVLTVETLFFMAFAFLAFIRSANPELTSAEKPMELAFINAILRSENFPPHDPWLSGYAISYYYFGYVLTAMLARLSGVSGSLAHNLMTSLVFGLAAVGSYGILYNLLSSSQNDERAGNHSDVPHPASILRLSFLGPLFLLVVSNLEGLFEVIYRLGLFWPSSQSGGSNFWTWLDMRELTTAPPLPATWMPDRYLWWWRASRVVQDYDLVGNFREVIDEFPFFSFLHADLHPHVLAIPIGLLAIALALNIFLGGWQGFIQVLGVRLPISFSGFFVSAFVLGGLAFLNTWDILIAAALILGAFVLRQAYTGGWKWSLLEEVVYLGALLGVTAFLLYLPFYFGFSSQAGGPMPNLINPTRGAHLWVMFGSLLLPILSWLIYRSRNEITHGNWKLSLSISLSLVFFLWVISWLLGQLALITDPGLIQAFLASQQVPDLGTLFARAGTRRLDYVGSLITLLLVLIPALSLLISRDHRTQSSDVQRSNADRDSTSTAFSASTFVLLLVTLGSLLVLIPEFIYLRDQFGTRLNTVFKFYYQAWILWSIAAAFGTAILLQKLRGSWEWMFRIGLALLLFAALIYPTLSLITKTNNFHPPYGFYLDDFQRVARETPDDAGAIQWLQSAPDGVVAEAVGGSYSTYGRVSTYSGLPTVLGWPGHESQWRGGMVEQGSRREDIETLYTAPNWSSAEAIIQKYHIRYIFIGSLERNSYIVQEEKFRLHLKSVFQQGNTVIYEVP